MKSYATESRGLRQAAREAAGLARGRAGDIPGQVKAVVDRLREVERLAGEELGIDLEGLDLLDVGAGQMLLQSAYLGSRNRVVGIDLDTIVQGFDVRGYVSMWRQNGPKRVLKTAGRKVLLIDARNRRELAVQMGLRRLPQVRAFQMDAAHMSFADASFDFVYSLAVFQHLEDPAAVIDEMVRVLRPGGGLYFDFILYSSRTGSHDLRLLAGDSPELPLWAHLRPELESQVVPNAYLNRLRLPAWMGIFENHLPGHKVFLRQPEVEWLEGEARSLWERGELTGYTLDELLTTKVVVLWRKPTS